MTTYNLTVEVTPVSGSITSVNLIGAESQGLVMPQSIVEKLKDKAWYGAIKKVSGYKDPAEFRTPGIYTFTVELNTPELVIKN